MKLIPEPCEREGCTNSRTLCCAILFSKDLSWAEKALVMTLIAYPNTSIDRVLHHSASKQEAIFALSTLVVEGVIELDATEAVQLATIVQLAEEMADAGMFEVNGIITDAKGNPIDPPQGRN